MAIFNMIKNNLDQVWCRKSKTWIDPEKYSEYALRVRSEYPTFAGCNQAALKLHKKTCYNLTQWPKQWGRVYTPTKETMQNRESV